MNTFSQYADYLSDHAEEKKMASKKENLANNKLLIWCAACSTGEEAYSWAMMANESLKPGYGFRILGTDIDEKVLSTASQALYNRQIVLIVQTFPQ